MCNTACEIARAEDTRRTKVALPLGAMEEEVLQAEDASSARRFNMLALLTGIVMVSGTFWLAKLMLRKEKAGADGAPPQNGKRSASAVVDLCRVLYQVLSGDDSEQGGPLTLTSSSWRLDTHRTVAEKLDLLEDCVKENTRPDGQQERRKAVWIVCIGGRRHLQWRKVYPMKLLDSQRQTLTTLRTTSLAKGDQRMIWGSRAVCQCVDLTHRHDDLAGRCVEVQGAADGTESDGVGQPDGGGAAVGLHDHSVSCVKVFPRQAAMEADFTTCRVFRQDLTAVSAVEMWESAAFEEHGLPGGLRPSNSNSAVSRFDLQSSRRRGTIYNLHTVSPPC
jgi:hypothetical protein